MNKKIIISTITLFIGTAASTQPHSDYQMESLAFPMHSTQVSTKFPHATSSDKKNRLKTFIAVLKEHPYTATAGLLGTLGLAGAAYLAYNKYQEKQLRQEVESLLEEIETEIKEEIEKEIKKRDQDKTNYKGVNTTLIKTYMENQQKKLSNILLRYDTKILCSVLSTQDEEGNTVLHRHTKNIPNNTNLEAYIPKFFPNTDKSIAMASIEVGLYYHEHFHKIIVTFFEKIPLETRIQILKITNNEEERLIKNIYGGSPLGRQPCRLFDLETALLDLEIPTEREKEFIWWQ